MLGPVSVWRELQSHSVRNGYCLKAKVERVRLKELCLSNTPRCRLFQITNLMHNSFIFQQHVCYTTLINMF